jgi:hypothetical protein
MQNLEKFINENRDTFDSQVPDLRVWAAINEHLEQNTNQQTKTAKVLPMRNSWLPKLRIAASVALLLGIGIVIGTYAKADKIPVNLATISPEHAELEQYYQKEIEKKQRLLVNVTNQKIPDVQADLQEIDAIMYELRDALMNAPKGAQPQIVRNMIESYKNKIEILERVLEQSNSSNINHSKSESKNEENSI